MAKASKGKHSAGNTGQMPPASAPVSSTQAVGPYNNRHVAEQTASNTGAQQPVTSGMVAAYAPENYVHGKSVSVPRRRPGKIVAIVLAVLVAVIAAAYLGGIAWFSGHFYPNTTLAGDDISLYSTEEAAEVASQYGKNFVVDVKGQGLDFTINSAEAGIAVDGTQVALSALNDNEPWRWPYELFQTHDETEHISTTYNDAGLDAAVAAKVNEFNESALDPVAATVRFDSTAQQFAVIPEVPGTKVIPEVVSGLVDEAVVAMETSVEVGEDALLQSDIKSDNPILVQAAATANSYLVSDIELVLGETGAHFGNITKEEIATWVGFAPDWQVTFDEPAMTAWVSSLAGYIDTYGTERTFVGYDGVERTLGGNTAGGSYGWMVDEEEMVPVVVDAIKSGTQGKVTIPCIVEAAQWNGQGGIDWGAHAEINLSQQHAVYMNAAGEILWESDVVTGRPDGKHDTPTGCWRIIFKKSPSVLKGDINPETKKPEYETPVDFWMPFTNSGCGFHDATWQSAFGGTRYRDGYGSHGCANLPYSAARDLYDIIQTGDAVLVYW